MTGDDGQEPSDRAEPRVPTALRERVDRLFVAYRGYDPASFQESLSTLADLAEEGLRSDRSEAGPELDGDDSRAALPWAVEDAKRLPEADVVDFEEYPEELDAADGPSVESILDTQHVDGVVEELAAEVLDEMTDDAFEELEHGVDQGVGAGVTDGMGATEAAEGGGTAPSGSDGDGVPDALVADPESDCERCGRPHRVSVLQTTILEEDGSVALVCPSCAN